MQENKTTSGGLYIPKRYNATCILEFLLATNIDTSRKQWEREKDHEREIVEKRRWERDRGTDRDADAGAEETGQRNPGQH